MNMNRWMEATFGVRLSTNLINTTMIMLSLVGGLMFVFVIKTIVYTCVQQDMIGKCECMICNQILRKRKIYRIRVRNYTKSDLSRRKIDGAFANNLWTVQAKIIRSLNEDLYFATKERLTIMGRWLSQIWDASIITISSGEKYNSAVKVSKNAILAKTEI